jgi:hypothetical protein
LSLDITVELGMFATEAFPEFELYTVVNGGSELHPVVHEIDSAFYPGHERQEKGRVVVVQMFAPQLAVAVNVEEAEMC